MSLSICYFDVAKGVGGCKENDVCVLYGNGSVMDYAKSVGGVATQGAKIVAVVPEDVDPVTDGGKAVIVYAAKEVCEPRGAWIQGKTLDEVFPCNMSEGGKVVNVVNIEGEDYVRIDKNCVAENFAGVNELSKRISESLPAAKVDVTGDNDVLEQIKGALPEIIRKELVLEVITAEI